MKIQLKNIGKKFNKEWVFRGIDLTLDVSNNYVIQGGNGSGKSTLLQILSGYSSSSEGSIEYILNNKKIPIEDIYKNTAIAAPYTELLEEMTLLEAIEFHTQFKTIIRNPSKTEIAELLLLKDSLNKEIRFFSSGMKQRVKIGLTILSNTSILLLDEPTSNLDKNGVNWYKKLIENYSQNRLIIVCSNMQKDEYYFCNKTLLVEDYKTLK